MSLIRTLISALLLSSMAMSASAGPRLDSIGGIVTDMDQSLFPPPLPESPVALDPASSCDELYAQISRLEPRSRRYRKDFFDNPFNAAIAAGITIWDPAIYLFAIPAFADYQEDRMAREARKEMDELRGWSAYHRCYEGSLGP